ncbi:MAG TPA: PaaI family thioesterase [Chloroflexia bacterium]|nr:PaaI family thioesterase [Chloroflexia bacterium]
MEWDLDFRTLDKLSAAEAANSINAQYFPGLLGIHFLEISAEAATAEMEVRPDLLQPVGVLHGGALTTLADTTCALVALANLAEPHKEHILTSELKIHFLGNVGAGKIRAEARPVQVGRRLQVIECRIFSDTGKLLCLMTCTQITGNFIK